MQAEAELQAYDQIQIVSTFGEPQAEYASIRKAAGLLDLPQRGLIEVTGPDRHVFLNNLLSNQLYDKTAKRGLQAGQVVYTFLLNLRGRIVADMSVIERGDLTYIETDGRLIPMLIDTLDKYLFAEKVKLRSCVGETYEIALHGPGALALISEVTSTPVSLTQSTNIRVTLFDTDTLIWRDDVCGVPGLHLILPMNRVEHAWTHMLATFNAPALADAPRSVRVRPVGWAAFNTARIEAGRPFFDIDLPLSPPDRPGAKLRGEEVEAEVSKGASPGILPAETGLMDRAVNLSKCYIGQEIVARMHARSAMAKKLVGIRMDQDFLPIAGSPVYDADQNQIGTVTSSTVSPVLSNAALCLAVLKKPHFAEGTPVHIPAEGGIRPARVVKIPFIV